MKVAFALIALVAVIAFLVRMLESRFAFFPVAGETVTPNDFGIPHEPLRIETADSEQLRAWAIGSVADSPAKAGHYLLSLPRAHRLLHGNGGNLSICTDSRPHRAGAIRRWHSITAGTARPAIRTSAVCIATSMRWSSASGKGHDKRFRSCTGVDRSARPWPRTRQRFTLLTA
jgi:hypothetical protein